jgi:1,4-alpha-glucan branching enzyme
VPEAGTYHEVFNSDSRLFDGSNVANGQVVSESIPWMHQAHTINLTLPPLAGIILKI